MKKQRERYENEKAQAKHETKAIQRSYDRILDNEIDYAVKSVRDLAMRSPKLTAIILQSKNHELHTTNNKVYFKNPATNWYVCLDIFW